ncbi:MAG: hypothetical protein ABH827_06175 [bacterium]
MKKLLLSMLIVAMHVSCAYGMETPKKECATETKLIAAVKLFDFAQVKEILALLHKISLNVSEFINKSDELQLTALHYATGYGSCDLFAPWEKFSFSP